VNSSPSATKVLSRSELKERIDALGAAGKRIVFTNGCFDLIHVGHTRYLAQARALGDVLVVGVNSDNSVARLKPGRPVVTESERAEVLASLEVVDYVTVFAEDTPYELIKLIRPHVLVKGGDWLKEDIVGADIVPEVHSLPYVSGASTTALIERICALAQGSRSQAQTRAR
jgi:D-beta-D-heptose 7-phosphate kinase/D-beta-D-heptose 1-phosphate adenosyltransferase